MPRSLLALLRFASLLISISSTAIAQSARPHVATIDSTSARCMDIAWLDARARCEGRALNATAAALLGASVGAVTGYVGASLLATRCIGSAEAAAARGAITGAALGGVTGLLVRHVSRRAVAEERAARRADPVPPPAPWSWKDLRPAAIALGVIAASGAVGGMVQSGQSTAHCGAGDGLGQGALVHGVGATATLAGSLVVVRVMF